MTLIATYPTPSGATVELHFDRCRFWTARTDEYGTTLIDCDLQRAREHYEMAAAEGEVRCRFPMKFRTVAA